MRPNHSLLAPMAACLLLAGCNAPAPKPSSDAPGDAAPAPTAPASLRVVGNEPFWGIRIEGDRLHFTTMEDQAGKHLVAAAAADGGGLRYAGAGGDGTAFELRLVREACSDGMSDRSYAWRADFRYGGTDYRGCADTPQALDAQPRP